MFSSISSVSATARPRSDGSRVLGALARRDALWRTPSPAVDAVKIAESASPRHGKRWRSQVLGSMTLLCCQQMRKAFAFGLFRTFPFLLYYPHRESIARSLHCVTERPTHAHRIFSRSTSMLAWVLRHFGLTIVLVVWGAAGWSDLFSAEVGKLLHFLRRLES